MASAKACAAREARGEPVTMWSAVADPASLIGKRLGLARLDPAGVPRVRRRPNQWLHPRGPRHHHSGHGVGPDELGACHVVDALGLGDRLILNERCGDSVGGQRDLVGPLTKIRRTAAVRLSPRLLTFRSRAVPPKYRIVLTRSTRQRQVRNTSEIADHFPILNRCARCSSLRTFPKAAVRLRSASPSFKKLRSTEVRLTSQPFFSAHMRRVIEVHAPARGCTRLRALAIGSGGRGGVGWSGSIRRDGRVAVRQGRRDREQSARRMSTCGKVVTITWRFQAVAGSIRGTAGQRTVGDGQAATG
jgi:hypothetical protein